VLRNSFAPQVGENPRVLVLGSMPGQASLHAQQYYAHPRNAFWPIILSVFTGAKPDFAAAHALPYAARIELLHAHSVALWDVLAECDRPGSLDSAIQQKTAIANPLASWLKERPSIKRVCFNGKAAAALYRRHILNAKKNADQDRTASAKAETPIEFATLPSTSPAMATLTLPEKAALWQPGLLL